MSMITYFTIEPILPRNTPMHVFIQDEKNELSLSPNVRLCGIPMQAHIETEELAKQFADTCTPRLQKRYGIETVLEVQKWQCIGSNKLLDRIEKDSEIIRKRLATGNITPNKKP